jgi:ACR3 family arsenite transporter
MGLGIAIDKAFPSFSGNLNKIQIDNTSMPIALGLLVMMYPVLAKVKFNEMGKIAANKKLLLNSLFLNWILGPLVMFTLAWLFLPNLPTYRSGLILVGLARCIAMVLIWNDLACGNKTAAALLVAINSVFQIVAFAGLGYFYLHLLPSWLGLSTTSIHVSMASIAQNVAIFLGIPLLLGFLSRFMGEKYKGTAWYEDTFLSKVGPFALYGLLFTIVVLFAFQGNAITGHPEIVGNIALPLLCYFAIMWSLGFVIGNLYHLTYEDTVTLSFTAAGNNFELALAVAISTFGVASGQALAGVVGPLIEVPVLVSLVYVALYIKPRYIQKLQAKNYDSN